jgi:DNA-binding LacI/PurR family transcriptional regulator
MAKSSVKFDYLTRYIADAVERGDYIHTPFPSERALAEVTGMSLTTVRKTVLNCIEKGYLVRNQTSGQPEVHPAYLCNLFDRHVAVILPGFPSQANAEWYGAVENVCAKNRFSITMITYHSKEDPSLIKHLNGPYDAIFFFPPPSPTDLLLKQMRKNAERLVTFFHDYTDLGIATLCDPPQDLNRKALDYLFERHCRSIDCLNAGRLPNRMMDNQIKDWQTFLKEKKCTGQLINCERSAASPHHELARTAIVQHLRSCRLPDAILCTTGMAAFGTIRGLADCSLRAGLDVKVLAISSNPLLKNSTPSITSMEPPDKEAIINQAFQNPRPLRIEAARSELFIGESTEIGLARNS